MYLYNYAVLLLRVSVLQVSRSSFQIGISHPSITMENSLSENTRQLSACLNAKPPGQRDKAIRDLSDGHPRQRAMLHRFPYVLLQVVLYHGHMVRLLHYRMC